MDDARIKLAQIDLLGVGPATIAKRLVVPGSIVPDADRIAHGHLPRCTLRALADMLS